MTAVLDAIRALGRVMIESFIFMFYLFRKHYIMIIGLGGLLELVLLFYPDAVTSLSIKDLRSARWLLLGPTEQEMTLDIAQLVGPVGAPPSRDPAPDQLDEYDQLRSGSDEQDVLNYVFAIDVSNYSTGDYESIPREHLPMERYQTSRGGCVESILGPSSRRSILPFELMLLETCRQAWEIEETGSRSQVYVQWFGASARSGVDSTPTGDPRVPAIKFPSTVDDNATRIGGARQVERALKAIHDQFADRRSTRLHSIFTNFRYLYDSLNQVMRQSASSRGRWILTIMSDFRHSNEEMLQLEGVLRSREVQAAAQQFNSLLELRPDIRLVNFDGLRAQFRLRGGIEDTQKSLSILDYGDSGFFSIRNVIKFYNLIEASDNYPSLPPIRVEQRFDENKIKFFYRMGSKASRAFRLRCGDPALCGPLVPTATCNESPRLALKLVPKVGDEVKFIAWLERDSLTDGRAPCRSGRGVQVAGTVLGPKEPSEFLLLSATSTVCMAHNDFTRPESGDYQLEFTFARGDRYGPAYVGDIAFYPVLPFGAQFAACTGLVCLLLGLAGRLAAWRWSVDGADQPG